MFNFFRKKESSQKKEIVLPKVKSILCIPGPWKDKTEILHNIVQNNSEYISAGISLLNITTKDSFQIFIEPKNENLINTFRMLSLNKISEIFLKKIENHEQIIYLITETGSFEKAKALAFAGNAILNAGGFGIHVESAGKAFEGEKWKEMIDNFKEPTLYDMFVNDSIKSTSGNFFSCGMHHLGLKDAIVYNHNDDKEAIDTLKMWGAYQVVDKPTIIKKGQTFGLPPICPIVRIEEERNPPYKNHELFHNPFGTWKLTKIK